MTPRHRASLRVTELMQPIAILYQLETPTAREVDAAQDAYDELTRLVERGILYDDLMSGDGEARAD